jgi:hypothetical protein
MNSPETREGLPKFILREEHKDITYSLTHLYTEKPTYMLWIIFSWLIAFLNLIFVSLSIRDMWNNGYSAGTHWLSSAVIVATMFGLMLIHEYIIRKKKDGS